MIDLEKIRWKNFLSTGNFFTEIALNNNRMILISGNNGAGKSTIMDAITFAMFNRPFRKAKSRQQLVNRKIGKDSIVELEFSIGKTKYKIFRGVKPNRFEVYENGELIPSPGSNTDYQKHLETEILRMNYGTFCQQVLLGSAIWKPFMQLSTPDRRKVIEDILDLEIFSIMNILVKEDLKNVTDKLNRVDNAIDKIKITLKKDQEFNLHLQKRNKAEAIEKQKSLKELKKEHDNVTNNLLTFPKISSDEMETKQKSLQKKLDTLKNDRFATNYEIEKKQKEITFYKDHSNCSQCGQKINDSFRKKQINQLNADIDDLYGYLRDADSSIVELKSEIKALDKKLDKFGEKFREKMSLEDQEESLSKQIKILQQQIEKLKDESYIDTSENMGKLKKLEKNRKILAQQREIMATSEKLLKDTGIKASIIEEYVPRINAFINEYLEKLDFPCQFTVDSNFDEKILSQYRDDFTYELFSQGEKMRIDLALLFTWRDISKMRNSSSVNLLLFDEVLDGPLDDDGTADYIDIITKLAHENNTVIVISHKANQISEYFDETIKFEKIDGFSRIAGS